MLIKTQAIVISSLKYGDNSLIVRCFTKNYGVQSYLLQGVLSSRKSTLKSALFQPFMQLEIVATHKNSGTLERIKEAKVHHVYRSLHTHIYKSSVALFLSEVCSLVCTTEHPEPELYNFLSEKLCFFDENDFMANFHLKFLVDLTRFLGFYPDTTNDNHLFFNLEEGIFSHFDEVKYTISGTELVLFKNILTAQYSDLHHIKTTKTERNALINKLLKYYQWHFPSFRNTKSLDVLQSLF
ncbi:DNA repair protein RecO [Capnocytophaga sp.]|uniref:DNA repair protein RecO n=1 Tax=Capnocytophaga sp. TaxID=44737 RepID=UPI0026DD7991|nr:DNA repair protein RecO [Capnocytophaga sp.]MDO5105631.1 DNA repair protein RecO [Capnocytophaga sp.]